MRFYRFLAFSLAVTLTLVAYAQVPTNGAKNELGIKHTFLIQGLHCPPCTRTVEASLKRTKGVQDATVEWSSKNAWITFDDSVVSAQQIAQTIATTSHMMGRGMRYQASLALKVPSLADVATGETAKSALSKVPGVTQVYVYLPQKSVAVDFSSAGKVTTQQLIEALNQAGIEAAP